MPTAGTLRELIERLKAAGCYAEVRRPVALRHELAAVLGKAVDATGQAVHFTNVGMGTTSVIGNVFGGRDKYAAIFDVPASGLADVYTRLWEAKPIPPQEVTSAPVQEVVHEGALNVFDILPAPTHYALDAGPFLTAALSIYRDPDSGAVNVAFNRVQVLGGNELSIQMVPTMHITDAFQRLAARGQDMPIVLAIGVEPAVFLAGGVHVPPEADEYGFAGAVQGRPLEVVAARTQELLAPANSEFVIEGVISHTEVRHDGPSGEMHRYHSAASPKPLLQVSAITHRADPIYHALLSGNAEEASVCALPIEARLLTYLRKVTPEVKAVSFLPFQMCCVVAVGDCSEGEIDAVLEEMMKHSWARMGIVVNDDINIDNPGDVLWAVISRTDAPRDYRIEDFDVDMNLEDRTFPPFASKRSLANEPPPPNDAVLGPYWFPAMGEATQLRVAINAAAPKQVRRWFQRSSLVDYEKINLRDYLSSQSW